MVKSRWGIMRQTIIIAATVVVALSVSYSVVLGAAVSTAISLCCYPSAEREEDLWTESCCTGIGTSPDCCCSYSEILLQNETLLSYESIDRSVYSYMCGVYTFEGYNLTELYSVDCEKQCIPEYIVYDIFRPPKV